MEGKSQKASGSVSAPKSTGSSRPVQRGGERSGAIPTTSVPEVSRSSHPSTVTLSREALERMIRSLKSDADPSLVLSLIGADPAPLPSGDAEIPEPNSENTIEAEEYTRMELGEDVEQQSQAAGEVREHILETIANPREQEAEEAEVNPVKEGVEGTSVLEVEQPLPTAEGVGESLVVSTPVIERVEEDCATQETENRVAMLMEESPDVTL